MSDEHKRLMQVEKLSAMGQMMSEIAHQLNNPLVGVINLTQLAERELDNPEQLKSLLAEVRKAGGQCRDFVQRMLSITKVARSEPQLTNLNLLAQETVAFFQQSLGGRPAVLLEAPDSPTMIEVDPTLLRNALFNLIHNAAQSDPTGPVTVSLQFRDQAGSQGCELAVSDHGPGISPELAKKLFTPFFTTRPGGTGLGLSIANHIAILHGGSIRVENDPGGGARFTIWLPIQGRTHDQNPAC
jgi:signal transduction histidine kinase